MQKIAPNVYLMSRAEWGASPLEPPGLIVPRDQRTEAIHHHTVVIDNDGSPNLWETLDEVKAKMRQLQYLRPDLGDVPYNFVVFFMADGRMIVCVGRGLDLSGAHTRGINVEGQYHNWAGIAVAIEGNTELALDMDPWITPLSYLWGWLKFTMGMKNLGRLSPPTGAVLSPGGPNRQPQGRDVYGHRAFSQTACPGKNCWNAIHKIGFLQPVEDSEMSSKEYDELKAAIDQLRRDSERGDGQITMAMRMLHVGQGNDITDLTDSVAGLNASTRALMGIAVNQEKRLRVVEAGGPLDESLEAALREDVQRNTEAVAEVKRAVRETSKRLEAIRGRLVEAAEALLDGDEDDGTSVNDGNA